MIKKWPILVVPMIGLAVALGAYFYRLGEPERFIGDEHYFVWGARHTLDGQPYLDAHPPLGKLQLAAMIKVFGDRPVVWRTLNAVLGALIVPLLWYLGWALTKNKGVAAWAMFFGLTDGFILVESRSAMINIPYVVYALGALAAILVAITKKRYQGWLIAAGILMGLAISVKWLAGLIIIPTIAVWLWPEWFGRTKPETRGPTWRWWTVISLAVVPALVYAAVWQAHFYFTGMAHQTILTNLYLFRYHTHGNIGNIYKQIWWQWPLLTQPFPYATTMIAEKVLSIWSMGNPWVWWTGAGALGWAMIWGWRDKAIRMANVFVLATWLPFVLIRRDMFIYHAMPFGIFMFLALAVIGGRLWVKHRRIVLGYVIMTALVFGWFAPWYLYLPLSQKENMWRRWLPTWTIKTPNNIKAAAEVKTE